MLESIKISNLALISNSSVKFAEGFNVLTGETGAGKSLIVDALLFLTGVRADKSLIKSGEECAKVEGVFSVETTNESINEILNTIELENEGTIIISRKFNVNGKNECRVNGEIVTLNIVRKLSSQLLDIFGQNDSQVLLDSTNHLALLDALFENNLSGLKAQLNECLGHLKDVNANISELGGLDEDRENNIKFLEFQIHEIDEAGLVDGQEEELKSKIAVMQNAEKISTALDCSLESISGNYSIENAIKTGINSINTIVNFDEDLVSLKERMESLRYEMQDIVAELENKRRNIVYSENELDILQDKLMLIKDLERKYGSTIAKILENKTRLEARLSILLNADEELAKSTKRKNVILDEVYNICLALREKRVESIKVLKEKLEQELKLLGMKNAKFDVQFLNDIDRYDIEKIVGINGADCIEFLFSANLGVEPRPLTKIISGGEMSRFMLAFKSIQNNGTSKTCIFDEIDTGIGGEIGSVVGQKICDISKNSQVICITHLAQIASFGDANFKIEKYDENNKTITNVTRLFDENRVTEIARMIGGVNSTSMAHAKEIISVANSYKLNG